MTQVSMPVAARSVDGTAAIVSTRRRAADVMYVVTGCGRCLVEGHLVLLMSSLQTLSAAKRQRYPAPK